ncbi:hypothetical protein [Capnocytophaga canimorsus]|uniref:Lipoprotein n=1 Tax=Capnocytophaga canimorsus TaxID=28188 RepID=A0A250G018_9FLAO|nr:hypothetical protein [Capnocytophaga canimorsus]ATA90720.1 hypothetical protein CGC56_00140 [Capnocytophaga canimorsus]
MKNIIYLLSVLFIIGCQKDDNGNSTESIFPRKELKPKEIIVKQGKDIISNPVKDGVITLENKKSYQVNISFEEEVELQQGEFLKMKTKNNRDFYADFYGRNANDILEKLVFKKEGYNDFNLQIIQSKVIPNFYIQVKRTIETNGDFVTENADRKTIQVLSTKNRYKEVSVDIEFFAPIIIEDIIENQEKVVSVKKKGDGSIYTVTIRKEKLTDGKSVQLPIYAIEKEQKGERIGEITLIGDPLPYYLEPPSWWFTPQLNVVPYGNYKGLELDLEFYFFNEEKKYVFVENVNEDIVQDHSIDIEYPGDVFINLKEDIKKEGRKKVHFFDIYEGILVGDQIQKKENAKKVEIFLDIRGY